MTTDQLESFIQVAENLSFARAAEILNITQSAVSRQIHALESELGVELLHRTTRTVTLTPAGISFLDDARHIVGRLQLACAKLNCHHSSDIRILSIGCRNEVELAFLSKVLKAVKDHLPEVHPFLRIIPFRSILNLFYQGELDILFGFKEDVPMKEGIVYRELFKIPLCCIFPGAHPYSRKAEVTESELFSETMVCCTSYAIPVRAAEIQNRITQHLLPEAIYICENMQVLLALVQAGYGCAIFPKTDVGGLDLACIPLKGMEPLSYGVFYKNGVHDPLIKKFLSITKCCSVQNDTIQDHIT